MTNGKAGMEASVSVRDNPVTTIEPPYEHIQPPVRSWPGAPTVSKT
jgi:hypothetical protein